MGGDFAPVAPVAGALSALQELGAEHSIQLVGRSDVIEHTLATLLAGEFSGHQSSRERITVVEAPDIVEMSDKPMAALRGKPKNSMAVGLAHAARRRVRRVRLGRKHRRADGGVNAAPQAPPGADAPSDRDTLSRPRRARSSCSIPARTSIAPHASYSSSRFSATFTPSAYSDARIPR